MSMTCVDLDTSIQQEQSSKAKTQSFSSWSMLHQMVAAQCRYLFGYFSCLDRSEKLFWDPVWECVGEGIWVSSTLSAVLHFVSYLMWFLLHILEPHRQLNWKHSPTCSSTGWLRDPMWWWPRIYIWPPQTSLSPYILANDSLASNWFVNSPRDTK